MLWIRISLATGLLVLATVGIVAFVLHTQFRDTIIGTELARQQVSTELLGASLGNYTQGVRQDVLATCNGPAVRSALTEIESGGARSDVARQLLGREFIAAIAHKPHYLQYRLLGADGHELVRADRGGPNGEPRLVPEDELQPKGSRDYFLETIDLKPGEVHVSPIELNREHGQIEVPHDPVTRIGSPVHFADGRPAGIVIVNVDMCFALHDLRSASTAHRHVYLINERGDYLVHPDPTREFGFERGRPIRFADEFPVLAEKLAHPDAVEIISNDATDVVATASSVSLGRDCFVHLICTHDRGALLEPAAAAMRTSLFIVAPAVMLGLLVAIVLSRSLTRPLAALTRAVRDFDGAHDFRRPRASGEVDVLGNALQRMATEIRANTLALESEVRERKQAEERFRTTIDASPTGMLLVDHDGRIMLVNGEFERVFGYDRATLIGEHVEVLVPEAMRREHVGQRQVYSAAPTQRSMGQGRDLFGRRHDGSLVPVEIGLNPIVTADGAMVLATVVDITDRRQTEQRLATYATMLERSNQDLEQFAYVVSHDLKAPLRGIASVAAWLAEDLGDRVDEDTRENIELMVERANRLSQLVEGILLYSRVTRQTPDRAEVDIERIVRDILDMLIVPEGVEVRIDGPLPQVRYDETQLRQVMQNLIDNAIRHTGSPDGLVRVFCDPVPEGWRVCVADNGIGIPQRHFERIFQLFQTLQPKDVVRTTGIGLSIVKLIVERNGGRVTIESDEGVGTTFMFTIPAPDAATSQVADKEEPAHAIDS